MTQAIDNWMELQRETGDDGQANEVSRPTKRVVSRPTTEGKELNMCFSGRCPYEFPSGECGKKARQVCPETAEDEADLARLEQEAQDEEDAYGDYLYEQQKERKWAR